MADNDSLVDSTTPIRKRHAFDTEALSAYLEANVDGFQGPLAVRQFSSGQVSET